MKKLYYVGSLKQLTFEHNRVNTIAGFPNEQAETWGEIMPTANENEYYEECPKDGYGELTGEQMRKGEKLTPVDSIDLPEVEDE